VQDSFENSSELIKFVLAMTLMNVLDGTLLSSFTSQNMENSFGGLQSNALGSFGFSFFTNY